MTQQQIKDLIDTVNNEGKKLNSFELGYMESITEQFEKRG